MIQSFGQVARFASAFLIGIPTLAKDLDRTLPATTAAPLRIEKRAADFESTTINEAAVRKVEKDGYLTGVGEATYRLTVPQTGWYELYVQATTWTTDLYLDGALLLHTPFASGVWETGDQFQNNGTWKPGANGAQKTLNLYLVEGGHTLKFSRLWHPGLPWMRGFYLQAATDLSGRVRITTGRDRLVFRRGEAFPIHLQAGQGKEATAVYLKVTDTRAGKVVWEQKKAIGAGTGTMDMDLAIPTDLEGIFDLSATTADARHVDRIIQFCVIDTAKPEFSAELTRKHIATIDCVATEPDYHQGSMRTVTMPWGAYRESGDSGREGGTAAADWFAYTLNLPEVQVPYVLEIDYPDDDERTVPIVLVEHEYGPPEPALGYFTGGVYPLSNSMLTQQFYIFPRVRNPRLLFYNWCSGRRAAAANIRLYRITSGFPTLKYGPGGRVNGMYQEEPLRHLCNFGAMPEGDSWQNILRPTERAVQMMNYVGTNLWNPTIAIYQSMLWPGDSIPGYKIGILPPGPATQKEPMRKDILRLMLLNCEKYGVNFVGDLHIPANNILMRTLDKRFGGDGQLDNDSYQKPWLIVSNEGEVGLKSSYKPYYNALHPGVQDWAAGVIGELAERYGDSPAFKGVSIRFMGWTFAGWQCFPSIAWGYGDYTIARFEKETGIDIPVADDDPKRFHKRYEYLLANQYDAWVGWRTRKMAEYHARLADILTRARPDLKLYQFLHEADFGHTATPDDLERLGWTGVLRETGIDLEACQRNPALVPYATRGFPDGGNRGRDALSNAESRDRSTAVAPIAATARELPGGTASSLYFGTNHEGGYVQFEKLGYDKKTIRGNKKTIYPDASVYPAGIHYLERFANAMADANFTWISEGSHGYGIGQPQYLRPFLSEYRALPMVGMTALGTGDPVALWHGKNGNRSVFYVVNRTWYEPVSAELAFPAAGIVTRLSTGEKITTDGRVLRLTLKPYELLAFAADAAPTSVTASIPAADAKAMEAMVADAGTIVDPRPEALTLLPLSPMQLAKAQIKLTEARQHLAGGRYWRARQAIIHLDMIRVYDALDAYPSGLFHRKAAPRPRSAMQPDTLKLALSPLPGRGATPRLEFAGIIGDARGKGIDIVNISTDATGRLFVLMQNGRVAVFNPDGTYLRSLRTTSRVSSSGYLAIHDKRVLIGDVRTDFPWIFDIRRQGDGPGKFRKPSTVAVDGNRIYVSDTGNKRIQVFSKEEITTPIGVLNLETQPGALAVHGNRLLLVDDRQNLFIYDLTDDQFRRTATFQIRPGAVSVCMPTDESVCIAYRRGRDHSVREYARTNGQWSEKRVVAPSLYDQYPALYQHQAPLVSGPDNQIWFGAGNNGSILSLDPATDKLTQRIKGIHRPLGIGFAPDGTVYAGGYCAPKQPGPVIRRFAADGMPQGTFGPAPLYKGKGVPVWGLLPDRDGGVYVRIIEKGYRKGWPAFTLKKVSPVGAVKNILDLGSLYAKRTRFHPAASWGNLMFDHDGNIILAAAMHVSVMKLTPAGEVLWEASQHPQNAAEIPFESPVDVAVDSRNNVWIADTKRNVVVCLSSQGKHLLTYGGFAGIDDVAGAGFNRPSGIATIATDNQEYLLVGDAGNYRFVKFRLQYREGDTQN
jgi:DNA-binding beta-propeller fold protein YncE